MAFKSEVLVFPSASKESKNFANQEKLFLVFLNS